MYDANHEYFSVDDYEQYSERVLPPPLYQVMQAAHSGFGLGCQGATFRVFAQAENGIDDRTMPLRRMDRPLGVPLIRIVQVFLSLWGDYNLKRHETSLCGNLVFFPQRFESLAGKNTLAAHGLIISATDRSQMFGAFKAVCKFGNLRFQRGKSRLYLGISSNNWHTGSFKSALLYKRYVATQITMPLYRPEAPHFRMIPRERQLEPHLIGEIPPHLYTTHMQNAPSELAAIVEKFSRPRIMVIGDLMVDQYIYGDAERLSPEAPVPVVLERYREQRVGGAGNVAVDLAVLGAHVLAVSVCGQDPSAKLLNELLNKDAVDTSGVLPTPERPTSTKTRLVGLAQHRHPQQMLRLDHEITTPITAETEIRLLDFIQANLKQCDLICLEDYNKGLMTAQFCQSVISLAKSLGKPVLVDPALNVPYSKYRGAATITPNRSEAERATGISLRDGIDAAPQLAECLLKTLELETCILTLDKHGMYLLEQGKPGLLHKTKPRTIYDVTGAGDMVLATLAMARACGATWSQAVDLANVAGGLEVEKFGIVPIKKEEILHELISADIDTRGKERALPQLLVDLARRRSLGHRIVFTNGVFDVLHAGHVKYLNFSRQQGDILVVGVNSDASVKRLKGDTRPLNPIQDRMDVLAGLAAVDYVVPFDDDTPAALIRAIQPDVLVKGEDYSGKEVVGRDVVEARGGKVILAPFLAGRSTTNTINKMKA